MEFLDLEIYDVYFATRADLKHLIPSTGVTALEINCIDPELFAKKVNNGKSFYDEKTFSAHVDEDLELIESIKPDIIIGDFRHSLTVSCRLKKTKYINITSAGWSQNIRLRPPMPESPAIRFLGERFYKILVAPFISIIFKIHFFIMAWIIRRPLARAGLKIFDYRKIITDGDLVLFCDTPEMIPLKKKQANELFIGPLLWSMNAPLPSWWAELAPQRKKVLLSLGSSGPTDCLHEIIKTLSELDIDLIVALSGKKIVLTEYKNVYTTDFLPIENIMKEFELVISNGGSPMTYAAFKEGIPVIGIVCNNDQVLNMAHVQKRGAGILLRYWDFTNELIKRHVETLLNDSSYKSSAAVIKKEIEYFDLKFEFEHILKCFG